jgi:hypothetical protein
LPADHQKNTVYKKNLTTLLGNILKSEKNNFANHLRTGFGGANPPIAPPRLSQVIANVYKTMDPRFEGVPIDEIPNDERITNPRQARIAYIRAIINLNRLHRIANPGQTTHRSFWDDVDADLESRRTKPLFSNQIFGHLVLEKDINLWDGRKTVDDWDNFEVQLPTDAEVQARITQEAAGRPSAGNQQSV